MLVVGAGAVGLAAAYYLRRQGMKVRVLDAGTAGAACSAVNAGWITPSLAAPIAAPGAMTYALRSMWSPTAPLVLAPQRLPAMARWLMTFGLSSRRSKFAAGANALAALNADTLPLYDEMAADGVLFEQVSKKGIVCAFLDPALARASHASLQRLRQQGLVPTGPLIEGAGVRDLEEGLSENIGAAFLCPEDRAIHPRTLTAGLAQRLREIDVVIEENTRVTAFITKGDRVVAAVTTSGTRTVDRVLVAAGAGTVALAARLATSLPIEVAKGYCLRMQLHSPLGRAVSCGDRKIACTPEGDLVRLAGIVEFSGDNMHVDPRRVEGVVHAAKSYIAGLGLGSGAHVLDGVESLAVGQRTMTPGGLPLLDRLPAWQNAFVSGAHAMFGITLAAASGKAMAEYIATGERPAILQPFSVD